MWFFFLRFGLTFRYVFEGEERRKEIEMTMLYFTKETKKQTNKQKLAGVGRSGNVFQYPRIMCTIASVELYANKLQLMLHHFAYNQSPLRVLSKL